MAPPGREQLYKFGQSHSTNSKPGTDYELCFHTVIGPLQDIIVGQKKCLYV
jgi:hypothetical protein